MNTSTRDTDITIIGGQCPVQAVGYILGVPFYFRARGNRWCLSIGGDVALFPDWSYCEPWGCGQYAAGYISKATALRLIKCGAHKWRQKCV